MGRDEMGLREFSAGIPVRESSSTPIPSKWVNVVISAETTEKYFGALAIGFLYRRVVSELILRY